MLATHQAPRCGTLGLNLRPCDPGGICEAWSPHLLASGGRWRRSGSLSREDGLARAERAHHHHAADLEPHAGWNVSMLEPAERMVLPGLTCCSAVAVAATVGIVAKLATSCPRSVMP